MVPPAADGTLPSIAAAMTDMEQPDLTHSSASRPGVRGSRRDLLTLLVRISGDREHGFHRIVSKDFAVVSSDFRRSGATFSEVLDASADNSAVYRMPRSKRGSLMPTKSCPCAGSETYYD